MHHRLQSATAAFVAALSLAAAPALAQKQGGTLRMYLFDSPPSASIHEEATVSTTVPFMAVFNNLVLYDQHQKLNAADTIKPELATAWAWDDTKTKLTFKLRNDVKWPSTTTASTTTGASTTCGSTSSRAAWETAGLAPRQAGFPADTSAGDACCDRHSPEPDG